MSYTVINSWTNLHKSNSR